MSKPRISRAMRAQVNTMLDNSIETANILVNVLAQECIVHEILYCIHGYDCSYMRQRKNTQFIFAELLGQLEKKCLSEYTLQSDLDFLQKKNHNLQEYLNHEIQERHNLRDLSIDQETEIRELKTEILGLNTEILRSKTANANLRAKFSKRILDEQTAKVNLYAEGVKKILNLRKENANLQTENANLQTENANLRTKNANLPTEIEIRVWMFIEILAGVFISWFIF